MNSAADLFDRLVLKEVPSISTEISYRDKSFSEACHAFSERSTIFVTPTATLNHLAHQLVRLLCKTHTHRFQEEARICYLLTTDTESLKMQGYPVELIDSLQKLHVEPTIVSSKRTKRLRDITNETVEAEDAPVAKKTKSKNEKGLVKSTDVHKNIENCVRDALNKKSKSKKEVIEPFLQEESFTATSCQQQLKAPLNKHSSRHQVSVYVSSVR